MRLCEDIVKYDLLDDISADDLNKKSAVDSIIQQDENGGIPTVTTTFASENYWFGFFVNLKDPDDRKTIERCVEIFEAYKPVDDYLLCKVEGHKSSFDVLFNIQPNGVVPLFRRLIFPLLRVTWTTMNHWEVGVGFSEYMEGEKPLHHNLWDSDNEYMFRMLGGKGVFTDKLHFYVIEAMMKMTNRDVTEKYTAFYQFLMFSVFKKEWREKFEKMKYTDDGMRVFDVELMIYSHRQGKWFNDCVFHVKAGDSTTMAMKLFLFAAFTKASKNIQYHLSETVTYSDKNSYKKALNSRRGRFGMHSGNDYKVIKSDRRNHGKHVIPMNDQLFKKYSRWGMMSHKEQYEEILALVEDTEYAKYVEWMRDNTTTNENYATGKEIIDNLEALAAVTQKFKI